MPLIISETNLTLTWSTNCVIIDSTGARTFAITNIKLYLVVITLSSKDNTKLLQQFKSGFKCTINWNNYQSHEINITETQNQYLNYLIDPSFHGANMPFVLPFEKKTT